MTKDADLIMVNLRGVSRSNWRFVPLVLLLLLGACDTASGPTVMNKEAAARQLLERDAEFAATAYAQGVAEAYQQFLAEDAVQLPDGGYPIDGREAIYENIVATLDGEDFSLTWEAVDAVVSDSGDLGYTWGTYFFEGIDEQGESFGSEGKYVNIWRKSDDVWKVALDVSNQNEPAFIQVIENSAAEPDADALPDAADTASVTDESLF